MNRNAFTSRTRRILILFLLAAFILPFPLFAASAQLHIDVGLNHFYKKRFLEAFKEFKAAVEVEPRNADAHYNLGRVYRIQGFYKEAASELEVAVALNGNHASARRELADVRRFVKEDAPTRLKIEGQEEASRQRMNEVSNSPTEKRAEEFLKKGDISRAIAEFQQALQSDSYNPKLYKMLGFLYFKQNKYSDALAAYLQAQKLSQNDAEVLYAIGMIHLRTQNPQEALTYLRRAVELSPEMVKAQYGLGEVYESLGQYEDALFQYRKCLEKSPNLSQANERIRQMASKLSFSYFSRGSYYYKQGDYEKSEALMSMAKQYGSLTSEQSRQAEEMLTAARYWLGKKRAEEKSNNERREVRETSYINKNITVQDVTQNPGSYHGQSIEWSGYAICSEMESLKPKIFINANSGVSADSNMDYAFGVEFPKELPNDPRVSDYSFLRIKGKIIGSEKILNSFTNVMSSRKQPLVEASEVTFTRENYEEPLVLRFY